MGLTPTRVLASFSSSQPLRFASTLLLRSQSRIFTKPPFWTMASVAVTTPAQGDGASQIAPQSTQAHTGKRPFPGGGQKGRPHKMKKKAKKTKVGEGSHEEVLMMDIQNLMAAHKISEDGAETTKEQPPLPEQGSEIEVDVVEISSTGDGLAKQKGSDRIYVVPFTVPGDTVRVKVYRHLEQEGYTVADFIEVTSPSPLRDDSRIKCKYFAKCSGCQFQMLDYSDQLRLKRDIVVKAYRNFSGLPSEVVPEILETIGSPLKYGYRTKLTPHFDGPPGARRRGNTKAWETMPPVGFTPKGSNKVMDIEECPIGTEAVNQGLKLERERLAKEHGKYTKGATILLRESTKRVPNAQIQKPLSDLTAEEAAALVPAGILPKPLAVEMSSSMTEYKSCITNHNATSTEYIDNFIFTNPAGFFFQNNNSILSPFTDYIRQHILPPSGGLANAPGAKPIRTLIDAYSGSGLFTITQSALFPGGSIGIDIAEKSIDYARKNALLNGLNEKQCSFIAADAPELFKSVKKYDPDETVVVLDPPRKGCDNSFLTQLLDFAPTRVVYVSCNVHTQARDVGFLVRGQAEAELSASTGSTGGKKNEQADDPFDVLLQNDVKTRKHKRPVRYEIESIRGFDFFPQTGHVEGVAVLNRVDS
ncbi:S-adenosyl-L-methionine-dependent methyltransferase [Rhypophila decipiens]|uniref:S-adenosyl-L-methionine-dependent methyltransferase n=1 Tax=Rhypophila decipiens TaxID=261697 RepID=A0AAN6XVS5_9PEZI|nr:S-adenosyl-L-methionine-dependent methyltransferase [Rhypophila decipiens]